MGRTATGVRGITLDNDGQDEVIGMICIKDLETESVMVVSEQGMVSALKLKIIVRLIAVARV